MVVRDENDDYTEENSTPTIQEVCTEAATLHKYTNTIDIGNGKTVHKSTALRLIFSSDPKSTDRLKRVAGLPRLGTCNERNNWLNDACFMVRDPFAILVICGDAHTLATFRADKLQIPTAKGHSLVYPA